MPAPRKKTPPRKAPTTKAAAAKSQTPKPRRPRGPHRLLIIDNEPIRREAIAEYQRLEEEISAAQEQVEAFEAGDLPAYQRWEASLFGPLLTELRAALQAIDEKRAILMEVEEEMFWGGTDPVAAYRRVMKRRASPEPERAEGDPYGGEDSEADEEAEGGDRMFGNSDLPPDFDIDQFDRMSAAKQRKFRMDYQTMALMYQMMTGRAAPDLDDLLEHERRKRGRETAGSTTQAEGTQAVRPESDRPADRLKELYRKLVRQLHPDSAKEQTARERELWHEVQEAYKARDLERMEAVAGRIEIGLSGSALNLPVQILRRMTRDLHDALHGLKSRISGVRKHPAWSFRKKSKQLAKMEAARRRSLTTELRRATEILTALTADLEELAARANAPRRKARKRRRREPDFFDDIPF